MISLGTFGRSRFLHGLLRGVLEARPSHHDMNNEPGGLFGAGRVGSVRSVRLSTPKYQNKFHREIEVDADDYNMCMLLGLAGGWPSEAES